jgi:broad specificity phosphatase PhoE/ribonuclease HI
VSDEVIEVVVEADGGSRGNPGPAGYGAVVLDAHTGAVLAERSESVGIATNNVAEYGGLIAGLTAARELGARRVAVRMDSKLVVEQMNGRWQVKHPAMKPLAREAADLRRGFDSVTFTWIPREQNTRADRLANEAMDRAMGIAKQGRSTSPTAAWTPPTGTPTRLLLARHGATAHSAERRFSGRNTLPLDDRGEAQAGALAARLATSGADAVVTSPLVRCVQTADAIAARLGGVPVETVDGLAEVDFGRFEGLTAAEAREQYAEEYAAWLGSPDVAPPGGESFAGLTARLRRARESVLATHPEQTVIVVSHVTPIKTLVRLALDAPPAALFRIHLDPASLSQIDYFADGSSSLRLFNDTSHLA